MSKVINKRTVMESPIYAVQHFTEFEYHGPIRENVFILSMMPLQDDNQSLNSYDLKTDPTAKIYQYKDYNGNIRHFFNVLKDHQKIKIISSSQVKVKAPPSPPERLNESAWRGLRELKQSGQMWDWFQPGHFTRVSDQLKNFLSEEGIKQQDDPLSSLKHLNHQLFSLFRYSPKSTNTHSPIEDILSSHRGVCQDYSHVMITIARLWGIAARYVSGYLYQDKGDNIPSLTNESHAWCECYLPSLGWLGFDPTNNRLAGLQHIKIAIGKDYKEIPPHNGFFKGGSTNQLKVHVSIKKINSG